MNKIQKSCKFKLQLSGVWKTPSPSTFHLARLAYRLKVSHQHIQSAALCCSHRRQGKFPLAVSTRSSLAKSFSLWRKKSTVLSCGFQNKQEKFGFFFFFFLRSEK